MNKKQIKKQVSVLFILQIMNIVYSIDSVLIKCVSVSWEENGLLTIKTGFLFCIALLVLGIYAVIWQMILGYVKLSVAYLSKALVVFWGLIWSVLFFHEKITGLNLVGTVFIFIGTLLVNEYE